MVAIGRIADVTYGKSHIKGIFRVNPGPQEQMKPSETPGLPTIPDNDAEVASIDPNSLRGRLADIQGALRQNNVFIGVFQNYRQLLTLLADKREQIREQIKELARLESSKQDKKAQQKALWKKIETFKEQINDLVNNTHFDGNRIFTAAGQDMAISVGDGVVINIPAKDFGVSAADVDLSENMDTLLEKIKREIQELLDYDGFLLGVEEKIDSFTTLMEFELQDVLKVEEYMAEKNMSLEVAKFSLARVLQDMRQALYSQANVSPAAAASLLINTN